MRGTFHLLTVRNHLLKCGTETQNASELVGNSIVAKEIQAAFDKKQSRAEKKAARLAKKMQALSEKGDVVKTEDVAAA